MDDGRSRTSTYPTGRREPDLDLDAAADRLRAALTELAGEVTRAIAQLAIRSSHPA